MAYTAKVIGQSLDGATLKFTVEFTDGTTTVSETVIPQDESGFKYWVKSRLSTFNAGDALSSSYTNGTTVDVSDRVVTPPTLTQAEINRNEWLLDYAKWTKVKTTLIDTGILTGSEEPLITLKEKVQTNFKASYLTFL